MRLIISSSLIFLKRSLRIILCAMLCLLSVAVLLSVLFVNHDFQPAKLAIINGDGSGYMEPIINSVIDSGFKGLLSVEFCDSVEQSDGCTAVLTLPEGFFESVMTGENIVPTLTVNVSSPLEGAWISALARNAARLLSSAQHVIRAVNEAMLSDSIPFEQRQKLIFYTDIELLDDYLTRKGRFESIELSSTGELSPIQYYAASGVSFILFTLVFLVFSPIKELKSFSDFSQRKKSCFAAVFFSCIFLSLTLTAVGILAMRAKPSDILSPGFFIASLLLCSMMLFFPIATQDPAGCAAISFGFCLIQAVFGGGLLPEALLPSTLADISSFMPLSVMRHLLADAAFGCGYSGYTVAAVWCVLTTLCCLLLWMRKEEKA